MNNIVLATVNGKEITQQQVISLLRNLGPERAAQFQSKDGRERILHELINQELFLLEAKNQKLDEDEEFISELNQIKDTVLSQYAIKKMMKSVAISDEEIKSYYDENPDQFQDGGTVRASHILVDDEIMAISILKEINEGLGFEDAAAKYSKCPSENNGGDLGFFPRGKMVQEFEDVCFSMNVNEVSDPVKTQFGFHLIKLTDKKASETVPFEQVRMELYNHLLMEKQNEMYAKKAKELQDKNDVKVLL